MTNGAQTVRPLPKMPTTHHPTICDCVLLEFMSASVYALLITLGTGHPETLLAAAVASWIDLTAPAVQVIFALVALPDSLSEGEHLDGVVVYRHILAACLFIASSHFVRSHRHWRHWGECLIGPLSVVSGRLGNRRRVALFGYRRMLLGLAAAMFLALFVEAQIPAIAGYLFTANWTYIRAPLLMAVAYSFACHAAAFRVPLIGAN